MDELNMEAGTEFFEGEELPDSIVVEHTETGETQTYKVVGE